MSLSQRFVAATAPERIAWPHAAVRLVTLACFFATLPIYSPTIVSLNKGTVSGFTAWFAQGVLLSTLAAAVVALVVSCLPRAFVAVEGVLARGAWPRWVSTIAYFVGCAGYTALLGSSLDATLPSSRVLVVACAVLVGVGLLSVCMHWVRVFASGDARRLIVVSGLGIALAALANMAIGLLPVQALRLVSACMLALGAFAPLVFIRAGEPLVADVPAFGPSQVRAFLSVMGTPLLGIVMSSFIIGVMPITVFGGSVDTQALGTILAGVLSLFVLVGRSHWSAFAVSQRLLVPVVAVLALAVCALPLSDENVRVSVAYVLFSLVGVVALGTSCGISNAREFPRTFVFATLVGAYCLAALLGLQTGAMLPDAADRHSDIVVTLAGCFAVFAVLTTCLSLLVHRENPSDQVETDVSGDLLSPIAEGAQPTGAERLTELAREHALTPREVEIVGILVRGHGCTYVAETLLISKSTVYTHVRNVYRKLGISNHEQLLELMEH